MTDAALLQTIQLNARASPTDNHLGVLKQFVQGDRGCHGELRGLDSMLWDEPTEKDFVALSGEHADRDLISRWIGDKFLKWWQKLFEKDSCGVSYPVF